MILITDVAYGEKGKDGKTSVTIAGVLTRDLFSTYIETQYVVKTRIGIEDYSPGQFYKRELPCLQLLWNNIPSVTRSCISLVVVDGLYNLWNGDPGLGHRFKTWLMEHGYWTDVLGIAKKKFKNPTSFLIEVVRGKNSKTPLTVNGSLVDFDYTKAIQNMYGDNRIPWLISEVDNLTRTKEDEDEG